MDQPLCSKREVIMNFCQRQGIKDQKVLASWVLRKAILLSHFIVKNILNGELNIALDILDHSILLS